MEGSYSSLIWGNIPIYTSPQDLCSHLRNLNSGPLEQPTLTRTMDDNRVPTERWNLRRWSQQLQLCCCLSVVTATALWSKQPHIQTKIFQIFLGPFRGPRGLLPLFSNSPSPATYPHIFPYVSTSFLTSFFKVLNLLMIIEPPDDRRSKSMSTRTWPHTTTNQPNSQLPTYLPT